MALTHATRNPASNLAHAMAIVTIALGLVISAFAAGAIASYGGVNFLSRQLAPQPAPSGGPQIAPPGPSTSPVATPGPTITPSATPMPAAAATPSAAPTPTALTGKVIMVSIRDQRLTAYDGNQVFLTTVVATGRPELPTPAGTFHIQAKAAPYKFVSPWPKGDPYWYPTEWVSYAMLFADDGYFLHDAPWRTVWGPGANVTNGSHGCVSVPTAVMARLYNWAEVGTTVVIQ